MAGINQYSHAFPMTIVPPYTCTSLTRFADVRDRDFPGGQGIWPNLDWLIRVLKAG